jgi:Sulfotransferase family/Methyltransferase domain
MNMLGLDVLLPRPIFIIGAPRSGTSVLAWALAQHPNGFWTSTESNLLAELLEDEDLVTRIERACSGTNHAEWLDLHAVDLGEVVAALGLGLNALFASRAGGKRWIDQTPRNTPIVSLLATMFPTAQFLHILRDGRRVVESMRHFGASLDESRLQSDAAEALPLWVTDFSVACENWREYVECGLAFAAHNSHRCLTVVNERLMAEPAEGFAEILHFLEVEHSPEPAEFFSTHRMNSSFGPDSTDAAVVARRDSPWERWTRSEVRTFANIAGGTLERCGFVEDATDSRSDDTSPLSVAMSVRSLVPPGAKILTSMKAAELASLPGLDGRVIENLDSLHAVSATPNGDAAPIGSASRFVPGQSVYALLGPNARTSVDDLAAGLGGTLLASHQVADLRLVQLRLEGDNCGLGPHGDDRLDSDLLARVLTEAMSPPETSKRFRELEERGFHVTVPHYYSPIPTVTQLRDDVWESPSELVGMDLNIDGQLELLQDVFPRYRAEYDALSSAPSDDPRDFHLNNGLFDGTDATVMYCMVRHFSPHLFVEIGSGWSSRLIAEAALRNKRTELVCIDPYADSTLRGGLPGLAKVIPKHVETVGFAPFERLDHGDMLSIDSSHVVRTGNDVRFLYLEVLPRLKPGVIVHVHDIFLPFEYPKHWVVDEQRFWNEQYLLQAFLTYNPEYEVMLCNSFLGVHFADLLRATFPTAPWWGGGSFWMRRVPA